MKDTIMKFKLNRQIVHLQKHRRKQEKQIQIILGKIEKSKPQGKEIIINKQGKNEIL